jgi:uncharacterized protein YjiS (DUF1127 family)
MNILGKFLRRAEKRRAYDHLMTLDSRMLRDIGLSRNDLHDIISGSGPARSKSHRTHE